MQLFVLQHPIVADDMHVGEQEPTAIVVDPIVEYSLYILRKIYSIVTVLRRTVKRSL